MKKMTKEEFNKYLNSFAENQISLINAAISLVASAELCSDRLSDIPKYMKSSLTRKVLRYVAKTAIKGTFEIDGLATSCSFCEMLDGDPVSFSSSSSEWSFDHKGQLINVIINSEENIVYYYDKHFKELWHCEIPNKGTKFDIVQIFEQYWDLVS